MLTEFSRKLCYLQVRLCWHHDEQSVA